jgi:hypothetical protein
MVVKTIQYRQISSKNKPSFYADPVAWALSDLTQTLLADMEGISTLQTGFLAISDECSLHTVRQLSASARGGAISPLRFAGASPSIVAGLPAIQHRIRGPTMAFTMDPSHAADATLATVMYWVRHNDVPTVIVLAHRRHSEHGHLVRGSVIRPPYSNIKRTISELCNLQVEMFE